MATAGLQPYLNGMLKEVVQALVEIFGAKKSRRHGEGRKLVFDKSKLDKLGRIYDLSVKVEVVEGGTHVTLRTLFESPQGSDMTLSSNELEVSPDTNPKRSDRLGASENQSQASHASPNRDLEGTHPIQPASSVPEKEAGN